jgi:hypothetical protein
MAGHSEIVRELLLSGARPTLYDVHGKLALDYASAGGHSEVVEMLGPQGLPGMLSRAHDKVHHAATVSLAATAAAAAETFQGQRLHSAAGKVGGGSGSDRSLGVANGSVHALGRTVNELGLALQQPTSKRETRARCTTCLFPGSDRSPTPGFLSAPCLFCGLMTRANIAVAGWRDASAGYRGNHSRMGFAIAGRRGHAQRRMITRTEMRRMLETSQLRSDGACDPVSPPPSPPLLWRGAGGAV